MKFKIVTPSRLHFSLIDLNGDLGRVDGGIGLTLKEPNIEIMLEDSLENRQKKSSKSSKSSLTKSDSLTISTLMGNIILKNECRIGSKDADVLVRIENIVQEFIRNLAQTKIKEDSTLKSKFPITVRILQYLKPHIGLGSTTQMSLAIAYGIIKLLEIEMDVSTLAKYVKRGGTSGIGFRAFEQGGFILDSGHRFGKGEEKEVFLPSSVSQANPARTILRTDFPEDWNILLISLHVPAGAANSEEVNIFQRYCPVPVDDVQKICHRILMQLLPGLLEHDLKSFGTALDAIQKVGFKKIEVSLQHPAVRELIAFEQLNGAKCVGMSSFGPTVFGIFESKSEAEAMLSKITEKFSNIGFDSYITSADNKGFIIQ